jgi:NitT/TauT family transport system permease protein
LLLDFMRRPWRFLTVVQRSHLQASEVAVDSPAARWQPDGMETGVAASVPARPRANFRFRLPQWSLALPLPLVLIALWQVATGGRSYSLIPTPVKVLVTSWDYVVGGIYNDTYSGAFLHNAEASIARVYGGFAVAMLIAIPLGLLIGRNARARALIDPTLQFLRPIPVTAWLPLTMILFGLGPRATVALIALGTFFPMLLNTVDGVRMVEPRLIEAAQMLGTPKAAIFARVILPAASPSIFTGIRVALGLGWVLVVVGEMTGVPQGLGANIMDARQLSRTDLVIAGMVVIGILGFISDRIVMQIGRRALWWNPSAR